ncbi:MAG TPA: DUF2206 domain-containing protein [Candidatus Saccharimonadales bacterium]|nr:DUF2206 domain-containing protein [Candidatus Saccharimonadales bacterium]
MKITRTVFILLITLWWTLFALLSVLQFDAFFILPIVGFGALLLCFGLPTYAALKLPKQPPIMAGAGMVGLGVLELIVIPLFFNTVLPLFGIARPLDPGPLLMELSAGFVLVASIAWYRLRHTVYTIRLPRFSWLDALFLGLPLLFICMSIMGATLLNNGGTGWITLAMLFGIAGYLGALLLLRHRLSNATIAAGFFMISIALLFMTSLRGWLTTGHDIQREYRMFELAQNAGLWDIASYRDPYNACLSITILPTVFANVLHINEPYVFKVLFQVLFATVPVIIYYFMRRYVGKGMAILAVMYFISFPTFFSDMPMLNRQEIAFLFLALMLYFVLDKTIGLWKRRSLFLLFGLGLVLSHYSTTYSFVVIMGALVVMRPIFSFIASRWRKKKFFLQSGVVALTRQGKKPDISISLVTVILLVAMVFTWNTLLTNTSQGLSNIARQLTTTIANGFKSDTRSNDTSYSLVSAKKVDPQGQLDQYKKSVVDAVRKDAAPGVYFDDAVVNAYPLKALPPPSMPLSPAGQVLMNNGFDVPLFNFAFKQLSARLLQLFIAIGIVYVIVRRTLTKPMETDFIMVVFGSLAFVMLQIVLPFLSVEYGLLRAFQQSLMVLGLFVAIGTVAIVMPFKKAWLQRVVPAVFALGFFLSSTSAVGQMLGGYTPQLHLNNAGTYYDIYYLHNGEIIAIDWLAARLPGDNSTGKVQSEIQSDRYALTKLRAISDLHVNDDIVPGLVRKDSYVFLSYANVHKGQATITYNSDLVTYAFPRDFLQQNKNLVYSNGDAEFYR